MSTSKSAKFLPMNIIQSLAFFGIPTGLLFVATHLGVPYLNRITGMPIVVCWFISGGILVFLPLFVFSLIFYRIEGRELNWLSFTERFRLKRITTRDIIWALGSVFGIVVLTLLIIKSAEQINPAFSTQPSFLEMKPLSRENIWILLAWLPFFFFNIFGEEFFWRGYIFPRQELVYGNWTWVVQGILWQMFHISFGLNLLVTLLPIIFITTYAVQRTRNTYVSILIHGFINGSGFLLISLGLA